MDDTSDTDKAVMAVARDAYGRLIAYICARTHDIAAAEDALSEAFARALETWPREGLPPSPEAWLMLTAKRCLIDRHRRALTVEAAQTHLLMLMDEAILQQANGDDFPDERLKLMFVCAHPAIDPAIHTPLMLQTVLGLSAERIAASFLVKPAAMGQRLSRAKQKIKAAGIGFTDPEAQELPERLRPLRDALYAAYGLGWGDYEGEGGGLDAETLTLARLLADLMGFDAELYGLIALMSYCEARKRARLSEAGEMIALDVQDPVLWDRAQIDYAHALMHRAAAAGSLGRYQLEALIQSVHIERGETGQTDWARLVALYDLLLRMAPSVAAAVAQAAALGEGGNPEAGLARLEALKGPRTSDYQPWWATRAHLLSRLGRASEAVQAYETAIGLSSNRGQRSFLRHKQAELDGSCGL